MRLTKLEQQIEASAVFKIAQIVLAPLLFVHELCHYVAAIALGENVLEFGLDYIQIDGYPCQRNDVWITIAMKNQFGCP